MTQIKVIECPRDAMQGIHSFIATELKAAYIQQLLNVGFDTLDMGSFVSPKAVPQMADTAEVLGLLNTQDSHTKLSVIVANVRGAQTACQYPEIDYLGYPFSISETFQQRNTRKGIQESLDLVKEIQELCIRNKKKLILYLSMAFGNPYNDPWEAKIVEKWVQEMANIGIQIINLSDTTGVAKPPLIRELFDNLIPQFPNLELGAHFHSHPDTRQEKLEAAWKSGCKRFDVALQGFGGCPFADDSLVGNIATESLIAYCKNQSIELSLNMEALAKASEWIPQIFIH